MHSDSLSYVSNLNQQLKMKDTPEQSKTVKYDLKGGAKARFMQSFSAEPSALIRD